MFYIHKHSCISPQQTIGNIDIEKLNEAVNNKLQAMEPVPEGIPPAILRRMGKAVRMGISSAMLVLQKEPPVDGIIIGTSNGGMEDCIKFLNQIIDYEEGLLTPANFVQSTANATAGQLGLLTKNKCYNITHVHRGLAFENALLDAALQVKEHPGNTYLTGAVEEISGYNYNIEYLGGWYKKENISNKELYTNHSAGSIAGEGAAMFLVNDKAENAVARLKAIKIYHNNDEAFIQNKIKQFISENGQPDLVISGENGDPRLNYYYQNFGVLLSNDTPVLRYKHLSGEYPTSSAIAFWLACYLFHSSSIPEHLFKKKPAISKDIQTILIYNTYKGEQHSLLLVSKK